MKITQLICLVLFLGSLPLLAQDVKFKKVSDEELLKTESLIDPEATAEYLYRSCKVEYEYVKRENRFIMIYTYFFRMKVYDDSDLDIGNRVIKYSDTDGSNYNEEVVDIEGYTFNMEDGKVKKEKLKKENIYKQELNRYWSTKKFAMPAIRKGSVIDVKYKIRSWNISRIKKLYFQQFYPVVYAKYETAIPEYFTYSNNISGFFPMETKVSRNDSRLRMKPRVSRGGQDIGGLRTVKQKPEDITVTFVTNKQEFTAINIPP